MTEPTSDGHAPGKTALLVIDMVNTLEFEGAEQLDRPAERAAKGIRALRDEADRCGVPVIYANDNFGEWHLDRAGLVERVEGTGARGQSLLDQVRPREDDFFVVKPQSSAFYATTLPALLPRLGASRLILTGVAADICVLFTAADAHMREYELWVPSDCVAGEDTQRTDWALEIMRNSMGADTAASSDLPLEDWLARAG
ncbi:Nicotinamidase-related amidase [Sphingomonas gellani]|uniref:Nicotinamidase-related amidase n=1 Tax=Sphingomonas gellani TaxID=1166340 RepID=A0A1H8C5E8_9SPHN|nr:isochorismatase family cysteine hydrolase [Sphingomonas gellani]SEM90192.1 Nicotinamidase-related amidase [Sphingomonas gellani]